MRRNNNRPARHGVGGCLLPVAIVILGLLGPGSLCLMSQATDPLADLGVPPFLTSLPVESGWIGMANGNLHLQIPLASYPQRGRPPIALSLVYDSTIWPQYGCCLGGGNFGLTGWGFRNSAISGDVNVGKTVSGPKCSKDGLDEWDTLEDFSWTDFQGTTHQFGVRTVEGSITQCGDFTSHNSPNADGFAQDLSGYHLYVTNFWNGSVYAPDGKQEMIPQGTLLSNGPDANGNFISNYSCQQLALQVGKWPICNVTDTLGRSLVSASLNGSTVSFTVLNSQGNNSTYTATLQTINYYTHFKDTDPSVPGDISGTMIVIQSIGLPDGTSYRFGYDAGTTPGHYGQLTSITLPTGAQITYTYTNFADSEFVLGTPYKHITRGVSQRVAPGGIWTFTPAVTLQCTSTNPYGPCKQQQTVTKPSNDSVTYKFLVTWNAGSFPYEADYYNAGGTLLLTQLQTWVYSRLIASTVQLPVPGGTINQTTQFCVDLSDPSHKGVTGNIVSKWEWKFYTGAVLPDPTLGSTTCTLTATTPPDRTMTYTYQNASGYMAKNIVDREAAITVTDKNGNTVAQTINTYDGSSLTSISGIIGHDDTNYGTGDTIRGNLTQQQRPVSGSTYITTSSTYDTTGQVVTSTDSNGNLTAYSYADSFFNDVGDGSNPSAYTPSAPTNAFLTHLTQGALTSSTGYYWATGQKAVMTDPNGQTFYFHFYDSLNRPTSTKLPDGGWRYLVYPTGSETQVDRYTGLTTAAFTTNCPSTSNGCRHDQTLLDNLGRVSSTILVNDPDGQTTTSTAYDANGRLQKRSNPYRSPSDPTYGWETPSYDGLDRVIQSSRPDGSIAKKYYGAAVSSGGGAASQLCPSSTYGLGYPVLRVDEARNKRQSWTDGFGRIVEADEPDSTGSLTVGTCYTYDLNDNLTGVIQGTRTRSFQYDLLSRLTQATNPETGTITYLYVNASGTLCSGDPSAVCRKTAPSPNQPSTGTATVTTTYTYDSLNRLTGKGYSDTYTQNPATLGVTYGYDGVLLSCPTPVGFAGGGAANNAFGRRTSICFGAGSKSWIYDPMGRIKGENDRFIGVVPPYSQTVYTVNGVPTISTNTNYTYYLNGDLSEVFYPNPNGPPNYEFYTGENAAGRITTAGDKFYNVFYSGTYTPAGQLLSALVSGNGSSSAIKIANTYNDRLQPVQLSATAPSGASVLNLTYNFNLGNGTTGSDNGNVIQIANGKDSNRTQNFTYDPLNRIQNAYTNGPNWGETYTIDQWANLTNIGQYTGKTGNETLNCAAANIHNQLNTCFTYDAAGNVIQNGSTTYTYDAENRLISTNTNGGYSYIYDGDGRRVEKCTKGTTAGTCATNASGTFYWSGDGGTLAESDLGGNWTAAYGLIRGRIVSRVDLPANAVHYYFGDRLRSTAVITDPVGTIQKESDYYPYGGEISITGSDPNRYKFTGKERDTESGLDNFGARYYASTMARFMTPDDGSDQNSTDPQSWNLYAYVRNNPLSNTDPTGNACVRDEGPNGLGPWHDDNSPGETCAEVDAANRRKLDDPQDRSDNHPGLMVLHRVGAEAPAIYKSLAIFEGGSLVVGATGGVACFYLCGEATLTTLAGEGVLEPLNEYAPQVLNRMIGDSQRELLGELFKTGEAPQGLTQRTLQIYKEIAQRAIDAGKDSSHVQQLRLLIINSLLK